MDLTDTHRTFHLKATEYTYFLSAQGMFSRIDLLLGHKTSLNKFKKIKITSNFFPNHNRMKLEIRRKLEHSQIYGD